MDLRIPVGTGEGGIENNSRAHGSAEMPLTEMMKGRVGSKGRAALGVPSPGVGSGSQSVDMGRDMQLEAHPQQFLSEPRCPVSHYLCGLVLT